MMLTDLFIISVFQPCRVVSHGQHSDDKVHQSKDAVQPKKAVPLKHTNNTTVTDTFFNTSGLFHEV